MIIVESTYGNLLEDMIIVKSTYSNIIEDMIDGWIYI